MRTSAPHHLGRLAPAAVLILAACLSPAWASGSDPSCSGCARFETAYVGAPAPARRAFSYVERIWSSAVASDVTIRIRVSFRPLESKATTICLPVRAFRGAADPSTWYPASLADALSGRDLREDAFDMEIFFSDAVDWYYGTDGLVPDHLVDFVSVALHEVAHGLGFASRMSMGAKGAFTGLEPGRRFPELSFEIPDLEGLPTVFDRFIESSAGVRIMELAHGRERSTALGHAVLEGQVYFGGPAAARRGGGDRPLLSAADPSHVDQKRYEWSRDGLMTPKALKGRAIHEPGAVVLGVLEDLGWRVLPAPGDPGVVQKPASDDDRMASAWTLIH